MEFTSIPIIVILCYIVGEIYKVLFRNKQNFYRLIPVVLASFGGLLGILIFLTNPEILLNVSNAWTALGIGMISGVSSTGTNQIIKQIFIKNKEGVS